MKLVVISQERSFGSELAAFEALFESGLDSLHFRRPELSPLEYLKDLENIPAKYLNRVVVDQAFDSCSDWGIKGAHIKNLETPLPKFKQLSASFHSVDELTQTNYKLNYVYLSPIFDSISKIGYKSNYTQAQITQNLKQKKYQTFALGGVDLDKLEIIGQLGFDGFVIKGALWLDYIQNNRLEKLIEKFKQFLKWTN